jgi:hypothetical protein
MDDTLSKDKTTDMFEKLKEETENVICDILEEGIKMDNIELLDKVVDIHKDIAEEEEIDMRYMRGSYNESRGGNYGNYGNYGRGRRRDSRGRYMESGYSTNRGSGRRYQPPDLMRKGKSLTSEWVRKKSPLSDHLPFPYERLI